MIVNKETTNNLDTMIQQLLKSNNNPGNWKYTTLKYYRIMNQKRFEVMEKLDLFEIIQEKYLHVVFNNIIW